MFCPVIQEPAFEAKRATAPIRSSGSPPLFMGMFDKHRCENSGDASGFGICPGLMQLALIPNSPSSPAIFLVKLMIAPFDA